MASSSSVNNIAATFSTLAKTTTSSSSSTTLTNFPLSVSVPKPISTAWNPHATIPKSQRSSLVNFYGPPGPPPPAKSIRPISAVHSSRPMMVNDAIRVGKKVPSITLSFLNRKDAVQTVGLAGLCRGRRVVLVGVSAAFSPACARFVEGVVSARARKGWDLIACVAVNDVFVMRAWGEHLAVADQKVAMLSDGGGELAGALGVPLDTSGTGKACLGLSVRSRRFCVNVVNGLITGVDFDDKDDDGLISYKSTVV